jgi:hypothetical protein
VSVVDRALAYHVFSQALEIAPSERRAFLDERYRGDPALQPVVERLLQIAGAELKLGDHLRSFGLLRLLLLIHLGYHPIDVSVPLRVVADVEGNQPEQAVVAIELTLGRAELNSGA